MGFPLGNLLNLAKQAKPLSATRALLEQAVQDDLLQIPVNTQSIVDINASIGAASGIAPLDAASKIPVQFLPAIAIGDTHTVANEAEMLALTAETGDVAVMAGIGNYRLATNDPTDAANWIKLVDNEGVESLMIDGVAHTGQVNLAKIASTGASVDAAFVGAGFTAVNAQDAILEVNGRVTTEAAARTTAVNTLQDNIEAEALARTTAVGVLEQVDTALQNDINTRVAASDYKVNQPVGGTIDGTNKVFTLPEAFSPGSLRIWMNNAALHPDSYTLDGLSVTFVGSPDPGDAMRCDYIKEAA